MATSAKSPHRWKSLVYFEAATTLALFIGVGAINLSKAAKAWSCRSATAAAAAQTPPDTAPLHWNEFLIHIFPENIVKSVARKSDPAGCGLRHSFAIALTACPNRCKNQS